MEQRTLGLGMATIIALNAMIGAGIFAVPSALQFNAGPVALLSYLFVIACVWALARSIALTAKSYPGEGAFYRYAAAWGGHGVGMIAASLYIIGLIVALGLLGRITGIYLTQQVASSSAANLGLMSIGTMGLLNMAGNIVSTAWQLILLVLTLVPFFGIALMCLLKGSFTNLTPFAPAGLAPAIEAIPTIIFGFFGFEAIPALYNQVKDPEVTVPKAITRSVLIVGALYAGFVASIMLGIPRSVFTAPDMPLSSALLAIFPQYQFLVSVVGWAIIITILGVIHAMLWALGALFAATVERVGIARPSQRLSVAIITVASMLLSIIPCDIDTMFNCVALGIVFAYALGIVALIAGPKAQPHSTRVAAILGLGSSLIIIFCAMRSFFS